MGQRIGPEDRTAKQRLSDQPLQTTDHATPARRPVDLPQLAAIIHRTRRDRAKFFDLEILSAEVWDMLLAAYAHSDSPRPLSVSDLCLAADCPPSTAHRWIDCLISRGLLERRPSSSMQVNSVALTEEGHAKMKAFMAHVAAHYLRPLLS